MVACREPERGRTLRLIAAAHLAGHHCRIHVGSMITERRDIQPALGHLEAALEETCATLIALESARMAGGGGEINPPAIHGQITRAIGCVRNAMSELRALHEVETSMLAYGFVLADPQWSRTQARRRHPGRRHDRPRRTA